MFSEPRRSPAIGVVTIFLLSAASLSLSGAASAQNLIVNGNFGTNGGDASSNSAPPWAGAGIISTYLVCTAAGNCGGFTGSPGAPAGTPAYAVITAGPGGGATQNVTVATSGNYQFSFYHVASGGGGNGSPGSNLDVTVGGHTVFNAVDTATSWTLSTVKLTLAAGLNAIDFIGNFNGGLEDSIGDVSLMYLPNASNSSAPSPPQTISALLPQNAPINAVNIAGGIDKFILSGGTLPLGFQALLVVSGQTLVNSLLQLGGELGTGSQQTTFDAMNMFMGTMLDPSNRGPASAPSGEANGYASERNANAYAMFTKAPAGAPAEQRWSTWVAGFGGTQSTDGNAAVVGSNSTTSSVYGTAVGADYRITPYTVAGFAMAGGGTNFSVANSGSGHSDLFQFGAFVKHTVGPAYIQAALAYGWQDITTNRSLSLSGSSLLRADFDANAFSGRLEGGYRYVAPWVGGIGITPYAAAQFTTFDLPGYAEQALTGSNAFALTYGAKDVTDTRSELGIRTDKSFALSDGLLILRSRFAWAHDYDPDRSIAATFQTLPGASFVVNGAAQASDSALVTASVEKKWLTGWSAAATFEGEFSDVTRSYAGKGVVRYQW
jgi:hypothetical protein